jgi:hypothetical protein
MRLEDFRWPLRTFAPKCGILVRHCTEVQQVNDFTCDLRQEYRRLDPFEVALPSVTGETSGYPLVGYQCGGGRCDVLVRARVGCLRVGPHRQALGNVLLLWAPTTPRSGNRRH